MYPQAELNRLEARSAALRGRIAARRRLAADTAARAVRPLLLFDRVHATWRRISPAVKMAALPLTFALKRALFPRLAIWRPLLRWSPLVLDLVRRVARARA